MDYKKVLRLHYVNKLSGREIAAVSGCSKTTVNEFLKRFRESEELTYPLPEDITNAYIEGVLYKKSGPSADQLLYRDFDKEAVHKALARKGETLKHLWQKYNAVGVVDGLKPLSYRQYCRRYAGEHGLVGREIWPYAAGGPPSIAKCVDSSKRNYLPSEITATLATLEFISDGLNVCILGPSDSGKSYLARAIGIHSCMKYRTEYHHCETFLEELVSLKQENYPKYQKRIRYIIKLDLLILDDFLLHTITDEREIKVLFEIMEKRSELIKSTIFCSQREPKSWASMILNDEVSSNAIMKRATKHYTVVIQPKN